MQTETEDPILVMQLTERNLMLPALKDNKPSLGKKRALEERELV